MQIKTTTDYAVRIILTMARANHPMTSKEISKEIGVSSYYIQQILGILRLKGIVASKRGAVDGGYELLKAPEDISMMDIIESFEQSIYVDACLEKQIEGKDALFHFWENFQKQYEEHLRKTTIRDLLSAE